MFRGACHWSPPALRGFWLEPCVRLTEGGAAGAWAAPSRTQPAISTRGQDVENRGTKKPHAPAALDKSCARRCILHTAGKLRDLKGFDTTKACVRVERVRQLAFSKRFQSPSPCI